MGTGALLRKSPSSESDMSVPASGVTKAQPSSGSVGVCFSSQGEEASQEEVNVHAVRVDVKRQHPQEEDRHADRDNSIDYQEPEGQKEKVAEDQYVGNRWQAVAMDAETRTNEHHPNSHTMAV